MGPSACKPVTPDSRSDLPSTTTSLSSILERFEPMWTELANGAMKAERLRLGCPPNSSAVEALWCSRTWEP